MSPKRFVFAPGTPVETYETMTRAFHLAEKYQVPAIVLLDQFLTTSKYDGRPFFPDYIVQKAKGVVK